jgi:hypothetical protein
MDYVDRLFECYELSLSNFQSCYLTIESNYQFGRGSYCDTIQFFKLHSATSDTLYLECKEIESNIFGEKRQIFINSRGGIEACFVELSKICDNVNKTFSKLEGYYNDVNQYYEEILYRDIIDAQDVSLVKRLGVERSKCERDFKYIYNRIGGCCGLLGRKVNLIS